MEVLRDLNKLAKEVVQNYNANFNPSDCKIPQAFKDKVKSLKSFTLVYNDYSVIVKGNGTNSKDSFIPNQTFYMASYFIEYSYELYKYRKKVISIITNSGVSQNSLTSFFTHERDEGKKDIEKGTDEFVKILNGINYNEEDREYLIKFVTDYSWWYGNKTIERNDFFNSPVLNIMGLSASSNSTVGLIVDYLTQNPDDNQLLIRKTGTVQNVIYLTKHLPLQQIFFGTPGSGKSFKVKKEVNKILGEMSEENKEKHVFRTTFHPDSDYASFVGCYKPIENDSKITYSFVPQTFTNAYVAAWNDLDSPYFLIIEEINRGNCAQIFGDLFQLLDRKGGYSEYKIKADNDLHKYLEEHLTNEDGIKNGELCLPPNLYIWATMNTSDQSLFPMDSAFKRRWSWEYVPIEYDNEDSSKFTITIDGKPYSWPIFLKKINEEIKKKTSSEDKQMGNFFIKQSIDEKEFKDKVMFYIWSEVGKENYNTPEAVFKNKDDKEFSFNQLYGKNSTELLKGFLEYLDNTYFTDEHLIVKDEISASEQDKEADLNLTNEQ